MIASRDLEAPRKIGIVKVQSRKHKSTTLSTKKAKNLSIHHHFLLLNDPRGSKPMKVISLEYYNCHWIVDEARDIGLLLLVENNDMFVHENNLYVLVAKNHKEYLKHWYNLMAAEGGHPAQVEDYLEIRGEGRRWVSLMNNSTKLIINKKASALRGETCC
jgi:hypothetical protein